MSAPRPVQKFILPRRHSASCVINGGVPSFVRARARHRAGTCALLAFVPNQFTLLGFISNYSLFDAPLSCFHGRTREGTKAPRPATRFTSAYSSSVSAPAPECRICIYQTYLRTLHCSSNCFRAQRRTHIPFVFWRCVFRSWPHPCRLLGRRCRSLCSARTSPGIQASQNSNGIFVNN